MRGGKTLSTAAALQQLLAFACMTGMIHHRVAAKPCPSLKCDYAVATVLWTVFAPPHATLLHPDYARYAIILLCTRCVVVSDHRSRSACNLLAAVVQCASRA